MDSLFGVTPGPLGEASACFLSDSFEPALMAPISAILTKTELNTLELIYGVAPGSDEEFLSELRVFIYAIGLQFDPGRISVALRTVWARARALAVTRRLGVWPVTRDSTGVLTNPRNIPIG